MTTIVWAGIAFTQADAPPQRDAALCVEGNRIIAAGQKADLLARYPDAAVVGGAEYLLLPGFVNSHDHGRAVGSASLGVPDDLLEVWLTMLGAQPSIPPYLAAAYEAIQLIRSGVTATAHSHNPLDWANMHAEAQDSLRGYGDVGVRVAFHPPIIDQNLLVYGDEAEFIAAAPPALQPLLHEAAAPIPLSREDYFALCADLMERYHDIEAHTVHIQVSPAGGQWCSDELTLACVDFARQYQTRVQMHMLETRYQRQYAYRRWGKGFIQHLEEIGAMGEWLTLAHMVYAEPADFPILAECRVGVAHNASSNLRLRSGVAPIAAMHAAGVRLGVGLDGHALDDDQDFLREMRLAWTLANQPGATSGTLTASQVLALGTTGAAAITFGADVPLGTLAVGQLADCVLIDWDALRGDFAPAMHPTLDYTADYLLRRANRAHVRQVMINGTWRLRDGRVVGVDETAITAAIRDELARQLTSGVLQRHREQQQALLTHLRSFYAAWDNSRS
jgi:cytosine/adenosine deaminase-related metal-dependent hydrolase